MIKRLIRKKETSYSFAGLSISIFLHLFIFLGAAFLFKSNIEKAKTAGGFVQLEMKETGKVISTKGSSNLKKSKIIKKADYNVNNKPISNDKQIENNTNFLNFSIENSDTSNLKQIYKESTLGVSVKYPIGWTFIDQDKTEHSSGKNKLDGVTFWSVNRNYSTPPYVHLEVKEKYLFASNHFKYKFSGGNYTAYYNDPVELSGQISQIVYIRTDSDEDFSLKLIVKGKDAFKAFQPEFFGMIKSFKFGKGFFN